MNPTIGPFKPNSLVTSRKSIGPSLAGGGAGGTFIYTLRDEMLGDALLGIDERMPEVGGPWESIVGGLLCNGSGEAFSNSGVASPRVMIAPGLANGYFRMVARQAAATPATELWTIFNYGDEDNYWAFGFSDGNARLTQRLAGLETEIWAGAQSWGLTSHVLKVWRDEDDITCYVDGVEVVSHTDSSLKTNTVCGLRSKRSGSGQYCVVDRFTVASIDE